MSFLSSLWVALGSLLVHKGRSTLTSLGIVIGVGAVIAMVSAGDGARMLLEDRLESVGKNLILVRPGGRTNQGMVAETTPLTAEDVQAVRRQAGALLVGVAGTQLTQRLVTTGSAHTATAVVGCTPDLQKVRVWHPTAGRFIDEDDVKRQGQVCVLGHTVAQKLFPNRPDPVGQAVRVE